MTNYYRQPAQPAPAAGARQRLEASARHRIVELTRGGAHVSRNGAQDQELRSQIRLLCALSPEFAARSRALAGLPARRPARIAAPPRAKYRSAGEVRYAAVELNGYQHTSDPQAYGSGLTLIQGR